MSEPMTSELFADYREILDQDCRLSRDSTRHVLDLLETALAELAALKGDGVEAWALLNPKGKIVPKTVFHFHVRMTPQQAESGWKPVRVRLTVLPD